MKQVRCILAGPIRCTFRCANVRKIMMSNGHAKHLHGVVCSPHSYSSPLLLFFRSTRSGICLLLPTRVASRRLPACLAFPLQPATDRSPSDDRPDGRNTTHTHTRRDIGGDVWSVTSGGAVACDRSECVVEGGLVTHPSPDRLFGSTAATDSTRPDHPPCRHTTDLLLVAARGPLPVP